MVGSRIRCKNNYFNHNSMNGLFLIVYTMALMFPSDSSALKTKSNKIKCSDSMTCTKCTHTPECVWSLKLQECGIKNQFISSSLIVSRIGECPKFFSKSYYYYDERTIYINKTFEMSNDLVGFMSFLLSTKLYYGLQNVFEDQVSINNKTKISFLFRRKRPIFGIDIPFLTYFMFIKFNGIMLRFDNVSYHYITFYEDNIAQKNMAMDCVTCEWNKSGYSNYLRWCLSENPFTIINKNLYLKNNATHQLDENVAYVANDCAEINVTAVEPLFGPNTGGTTVTIIIRNHILFKEDRWKFSADQDHRQFVSFKVTVAGTACNNPGTYGLETIKCTTSQAVGALSGPVLVEYSSSERVLKIESSQIFQFCLNPVLDADQRLDGVKSGGTSVPVRGSHFIEPCFVSSARLYVDLPDGVRRYADSTCDPPVNDTYMVCRSPGVNGVGQHGNTSVVGQILNFGLNITFSNDKFSSKQSLPIVVRDPYLFYVHADPVLLDFEIDVNGSVVVNGLNLQHILLDDIVVRSVDSPSKICVVVSVTQHRLVCEPTMSVNASQVISVRMGSLLVFTVVRRKSTHPEDPSILPEWFLTIMSTVLVFVCAFAFACYLRTKNRYNAILTRSQDLL